MSSMKVWVGCMACYNAGRLNGEWLPAAEATSWNCADPQHDECWVFDTDSDSKLISGEMAPAEAQQLAEAVAECVAWCEAEHYPFEAFEAYLDNQHLTTANWLESRDSFTQSFMGEWADLEAYADELAHEAGLCQCMTNKLWNGACYFDTEAFARDLDASGYWCAKTGDGYNYVFSE